MNFQPRYSDLMKANSMAIFWQDSDRFFRWIRALDGCVLLTTKNLPLSRKSLRLRFGSRGKFDLSALLASFRMIIVPPEASNGFVFHFMPWRVPVSLPECGHLDVECIERNTVLIITARGPETPSILSILAVGLRHIVHKHACVSLRGFKQDDDLCEIAEHFGSILDWEDHFGKILEIRSSPESHSNSQSLEPLPMHFDGMFKKKSADAKTLGDVPLFQLFHCVNAYPQHNDTDTGRTLFADTRKIWKSWGKRDRARAKRITLAYRTKMFDNPHLLHISPLIDSHAFTRERVIRYHEPWPESVTKHNSIHVSPHRSTFMKHNTQDAIWAKETIVHQLYSAEFCYRHSWVKGEFLIADNVATLHARTSMNRSGRHIRRIHIN
uniref:Uncharacterized protein AlNc14C88G5592 n=1 Tax=Albugo laibachii Nc14 TaxID=890382 RepID=F0WG62_9STRA|nr:conserved hypothetical protein [Albugo laibachii Nc14]|eukprot:CCA20197.1 conserved hypothetical protein [Albugo laibachii Nc14]